MTWAWWVDLLKTITSPNPSRGTSPNPSEGGEFKEAETSPNPSEGGEFKEDEGISTKPSEGAII
jgi:hypothetical protein